MKIKFNSNAGNYSKGQIKDLGEAEAENYIGRGLAVKVKNLVNAKKLSKENKQLKLKLAIANNRTKEQLKKELEEKTGKEVKLFSKRNSKNISYDNKKLKEENLTYK